MRRKRRPRGRREAVPPNQSAGNSPGSAAIAPPSPWQRFVGLSKTVKAAIGFAVSLVPILTFLATTRNNFEQKLEPPAARLRSDNAAEWSQAIRDLERLGTSDDRASRVAEHLFAFVKRHAMADDLPADAEPCTQGALQRTYTRVPDDVAAAVLALARMLVTADDSADLHGAYLPGLRADETPLRPLLLARSCLRAATLDDVSGAMLDSANLDGANLADANLRDTRMHYTSLVGADLTSADLSGGLLRGAKLKKARLRFSDLSFAIAPEADFTAADIYCTDLTFAHLEAAVFESVQSWRDVWKFTNAYLYAAQGLDSAQTAAAAAGGASFDTIPPLRRDSARVRAYAARGETVDPCRRNP